MITFDHPKSYYVKKLLFLLLIAASALASCVKSLDGLPDDSLKKIILGKDSLSMYVGQVEHIVVTLTPTTYDASTLKWSSSDTAVISVTNSGTISAKKPGTSKITVSNLSNTVSVSALVTVNDKPVVVVPIVDSLARGLIAYYPFNNSATDSSGHGNDGVAKNLTPATNRFDKANSAYYFDGASSFILVKDKQELRLNNTNFTLNMWINLDEYNVSSGSALLAKNSGPYQNGWNCSITGLGTANTNIGNAFYNVSGGDDPHAVGDTVLGLHKWRMVTITYDLVLQTVSFYINGKFDHSTNGIPTPNAATAADLFIGKNSYIDPSGLTPPYYIKGKMDDIRMYNRKITTSEISKLYNLPY
jgi:hypothetical protein